MKVKIIKCTECGYILMGLAITALLWLAGNP